MAIKPAVINDTLLPIVASVQRLLSEQAGAGAKTVVPPPQRAVDASSMEFAQRVVQRFLATQGEALRRGVDLGDVSDALLKLLLEEDSQRRVARNQWTEIRNSVRQASVRLGAALAELHQTVKTLGMGYRPTLIELADSFTSLIDKNGGLAAFNPQLIDQLLARGVLAGWQAALLRLWQKRKKGTTSEYPSADDLVAMFLDPEVIEQLSESGEGPWDAYVAQAAALRAHRHLGQAMEEMSE